ncbi:MAG: DNA polymerase I [Deltaproteobacteria bacterium]|nr:DNA polymerase I [Deltaproteobacteria bacterium]
MDERKVLYLIDGSSYIYRAFFAIAHLSNSKGMPTQAIYGFVQMVNKVLEEQQPRYLALVFDAKGPTFRHEIYPEYKAHRPPMPDALQVQIPYIKEISQAYGFPILEKEGLEADDLIGTLARQAQEKGFEVVIISGDKDLMQLVSPKVWMWDTLKDQVFDQKAVRERFGSDPAMLPDIFGLAGDSSDNIPGVPGIGEKTAVKLIHTHGTLERLLADLPQLTPLRLKEKIEKNRDQALLSRKLATIDTEVPLDLAVEDLKPAPADPEKLKALFTELEFKKFLDGLGEVVETRDNPRDYEGVFEQPELDRIIREIKKAGHISLDLETTSADPLRAEIVGIALSWKEGAGFYVPVGHTYLGAPRQLKREQVLADLKELIEDPEIKKIGQNIKYEWLVLRHYGLDYRGIAFDTMLASYLLNPGRRTHGLDQIAWEHLNQKLISYKEVTGTGSKALNFSQVPVPRAVEYAAEDAEVTLTLSELLGPLLHQAGLKKLFRELEMPLITVLGEMEWHGIRIDTGALADLSKELEGKLAQIEDQIYALAGDRFNINSPQQLSQILFDKLQLPSAKKTKGKSHSSTDAEVLRDLSLQYPICTEIWNYRSLSKLKSTYVDALPKLLHPETGRLHTSFNQTVTATGRLSSSDPNLQNIPVRTEEGRRIRQAFVADPGWLLLSADYSQIELRIMAHYSGDPSLVEAFLNEEDIHTRTAAELNNVSPGEVTPDMRRQAKVINFGIIYGMSAFGLSKELGIGAREAQEMIDRYFLRYQGVKEFLDRTIAEARETKMVTTLFNRRRIIEEINSSNRVARQFAERTPINTPIQGSAADLIKKAMIVIAREMKGQGLQARMLLQVHDELVFEAPEQEVEALKKLVKEHMESAVELRVPLTVQISTGRNWAELK